MSLTEVDFVDENKTKKWPYYIDLTGKVIFVDENGNDLEDQP